MSKIRTLYDVEQEKMQEERREGYKKYMGDIHRGDVFYFTRGNSVGVEQQGGRPGVIVSNDKCNNSSDFLLVCYLTTQPKTFLPTHVPIVCNRESTCLCEQVHTLSKEKMERYCCTLTPEEMTEIDKALIIALGIDLKNVIPEDYKNTIKDLQDILREKEEQITFLETEINAKDKEIEKQLSYNSKLVDEIQKLKKQNMPTENTPEYIRVCAERDIYMKLYKDLLSQQ